MHVVYLFYQVSDKRLLPRCGKDESFLTEAEFNSADLRIPHQRCRSPEMKIRSSDLVNQRKPPVVLSKVESQNGMTG